jgi:hypothetical protein
MMHANLDAGIDWLRPAATTWCLRAGRARHARLLRRWRRGRLRPTRRCLREWMDGSKLKRGGKRAET